MTQKEIREREAIHNYNEFLMEFSRESLVAQRFNRSIKVTPFIRKHCISNNTSQALQNLGYAKRIKTPSKRQSWKCLIDKPEPIHARKLWEEVKRISRAAWHRSQSNSQKPDPKQSNVFEVGGKELSKPVSSEKGEAVITPKPRKATQEELNAILEDIKKDRKESLQKELDAIAKQTHLKRGVAIDTKPTPKAVKTKERTFELRLFGLPIFKYTKRG